MLKKAEFAMLTAIGIACVLLAILNIVLYSGNETLRSQAADRAQYIQQTAQLQGLYRQMAQALADLSVRNNDPKLREVLARQGLHVTVTSKKPAAAAPAPAEKGSAVRSPKRGKQHE